MASVVYALCALTSALCAALLLRAYWNHGARLLLWSGISFVGLTCNNTLLFLDFVVVPAADFSLYRSVAAATSMTLLLASVIWDSR